jgi:hypothetical protein
MENTWLRLDNAAKLYPAKMCADDTCVYRVYAILKEQIQPELLHKSVTDLRKRFPTFYVKLRNGFFWNYYEPNERELIVKPENGEIARLLNGRDNNGYLFSVQYDHDRISLEAFHALGDGTAAIEYLNALLYRYLTLRGYSIDPMGCIATIEQEPSEAEIEDSYDRYYTGPQKREKETSVAYQIKGTPFARVAECGVLHGIMDAAELVNAAHSHHTTVTKYLTVLLVQSIWLAAHDEDERQKRPICINIPVNMRNRLPSKTLRNFALFFTAQVAAMNTLGSFEEILSQVEREFEHNSSLSALQRLLNANVSVEKSRLISCLPLPIKRLAINTVARSISDNHLTSSLSNLGQVRLPDAMIPLIDHYGIIPPLGTDIPVVMAAISTCGKTEITFIRKITETEVEQFFFKSLACDGVNVILTTNIPE